MGLTSIIHNLFRSSALGLALYVSGCSSDKFTGCQNDFDCREGRICDAETLRCVERDGSNGNNNGNGGNYNGNDGGTPNGTDPEAIDICDGLDNNGDGFIDELGCGKLYLYYGGSPENTLKTLSLSTLQETVLSSYDSDYDIADNKKPLSPDGTKFLMEKTGTLGPEGLYYLDLSNQSIYQITSQPGGQPSWFPDSQHLAYVDSYSNPIYLRTIDIQGNNLQTIAEFYTPWWIWSLAVSPDGQKMAFTGCSEWDDNAGWDENVDCFEMYLIDSTGNNLQRLTFNNRPEYEFEWSNDSQRIFYAQGGSEPNKGKIHSIFTDGSDERVETEEGFYYITFNPENTRAVLRGPGKWKIWNRENNKLYPFPLLNNLVFAWREE